MRFTQTSLILLLSFALAMPMFGFQRDRSGGIDNSSTHHSGIRGQESHAASKHDGFCEGRHGSLNMGPLQKRENRGSPDLEARGK
jgi:hypothetical protein